MKYPFIIFYRKDQYSIIDTFFYENSSKLECTIFLTCNKEDLNKMYDSNYHLLITYGDSFHEYIDINEFISERILTRHFHIETNKLNKIEDFNEMVNKFFIESCSLERELTRPVFSAFTTAFNSFDKIWRVYHSLKHQTLKDWEWIIIDDSLSDNNFNYLRDNLSCDSRIKIFRRFKNSGSIGNVKNEAISLCRGKYLIEIDHDDEILPFVLEQSADLFDKYLDVGFIYMDFICKYENGNNQFYGDFICKGYGGYYSQKYKDKWVLVYITPNINNITLSHLVCCPNHPRIWRKDIMLQLGNYCEHLPICDDYEILLKTSLSTKIAKIHTFGYIQYMNDNNNNFSLIRNSEINRIGPKYISPIYYKNLNINEKMKQLDAYEDENYSIYHSNIYKRNPNQYQHKFCNKIVNFDYDFQYCVINISNLTLNIDFIKKLYDDKRNDFLILDNKHSLEELQKQIDEFHFDRMKCYSLKDANDEELVQYFKLLYNSVKNYKIINCKM